MLYSFNQPNDLKRSAHVIQYPDEFTPQEIDEIRKLGDCLDKTDVKLYGQYSNADVHAAGSHFHLKDDTRWIYTKMDSIVQKINKTTFQYDLTGFHENFYYLRYESGDHFNWHLDIGGQTPAPRKLSFVLQLSDPSEYDGGDFDVLIASDHIRTEKGKGMLTVFPSFKPHRVTPVVSGIRRTLTIFACGPNFR